MLQLMLHFIQFAFDIFNRAQKLGQFFIHVHVLSCGWRLLRTASIGQGGGGGNAIAVPQRGDK